MRVCTSKVCGGAVLVLLAVCPSAVRGQQTQDQQQAPVPAYSTPLGSVFGGNQPAGDAAPQTLSPDKTPPTGAQELSLGTPAESRTYWQPHFYVTATGDSNPLAGNQKSWVTYTSILGGLDLHKTSTRSDLAVMYSGGGTISNDGNIGNSVIQQLGLSEKISGRRTTLSLFDQLGYIPEAGFGYGGGGVGLPVGGLAGLQTGFLPGQTILTQRGQRLTNSSVVELDRNLTARNALTFTGGYSLMHYFDVSLLNFNDTIIQTGFSRQLSRENTAGFLYLFNAYRFSGYGETIYDHSVQLSYGRKLTGRLAFRAQAGPEVAVFHQPATARLGTGPSAPPTTDHLYGSGSVALTYQLERTGLGFGYNHGVSGGSGVFAGALTDQVSGYVNRTLSRASSAGFNFGYSRNRGLGTLNAANQNQVYGYWFGGVNWNHPFSRTTKLALSYQMEYQSGSSSFCVGLECGRSLVRHEASMTF